MADDRSNLKLQSGDVLSANIWNRVIDRLPDRGAGVGTDVHLINKTVVQCKAHTDIGIAQVWSVNAYLGDTTDIYEIAPTHILSVTNVVWPETCHKLVVAERPVLQDEIGPFAYNGGAIVELTAGVGDHAFPDPADTTKMKQGSSGYRILNLVGSDRAVVDLAEPQNLWLYQLTEAYTGGASGNGHILTLYDEQFSNNPTTINFEGDCKPDALQSGHKGYCVFADGAFWAIDQCGGGGEGGQTKRIRFVLENKFNDTGQALANVLDTFGTTGLVRGDQVVVNDPRKLFAHAIGYTQMNFTPAQVSDFPCGGSVGYAVWTEAPDIDPPSTAEYPRYEVEQCTQTVERMKVFVYESGSGSTGTAKSRPTGQMPTVDDHCTLYFADQSNFMSRWPDVDYCESWTDVDDPNVPQVYKYKLVAKNPHRFSAKRGSWCIVEKSTTPQRPQDACNDRTPYSGTPNVAPEWIITDVELPIARWIRVSFVSNGEDGNPDVWEYGGDFAEGEDPTVNYFPDNVQFRDRIQTATGMETGCMKPDEIGWAFWDPNDQMYNVVVTNSALYGSPIDVKIVGNTDLETDLLSATGCALSYPEFSSIPVFGIQPPDCEVEPTNKTVALATTPVDVVTGATIVGTEMCLTTGTIYVCDTGVGPNPPICLDICDPCHNPTGCCVVTYSDHVDYVAGQTVEQCDEYYNDPLVISAVWTEGPCPSGDCCEGISAATIVSHAFFSFTGFMGDTTEGHFVAGSSSTSLTGECGITITFDVQWSNGTCQAQQTTSATAELKTNGTCCYWEVTLTQPTAPCIGGMGDLGDGWPSDVVNIIGCSGTGEFDQDCSTFTGDCAAVCDNGGFDSVQMTVDNIGGCQA